MKNGFTLLEAIIYVAIFSLMLSGALLVTYQLIVSSERGASNNGLEAEANFLLRKINWLVEGATTLNISQPDVLEITNHGQTFILTLDPTIQALTLDGQPLNNSRTKISELQFTPLTPAGVETAFKLNDRAPLYEPPPRLHRFNHRHHYFSHFAGVNQ